MNDTLPIIKKIISENFGTSEDQITVKSNFYYDLNLSEIETSDLINLCVEKFNLILPDDYDTDQIQTVEDLENLIEVYGD